MNKEKLSKAIIQQGVIPLFYHPDEATGIEMVQALYDAGIRVIEYTNRGKQAMKNLRCIKKETYKRFPDLILGMGTLLDPKAAEKAIQNGADFLVSPGYTRELSKFSYNENMLWIPGCITPTEFMLATDDGISLVKLFPASSVTPGFIKSNKEVFPELQFMPTGGINNENVESWFRAGASVVGMGGSLVSNSIVEKKDWKVLRSNTEALLKQVSLIRGSL